MLISEVPLIVVTALYRFFLSRACTTSRKYVTKQTLHEPIAISFSENVSAPSTTQRVYPLYQAPRETREIRWTEEKTEKNWEEMQKLLQQRTTNQIVNEQQGILPHRIVSLYTAPSSCQSPFESPQRIISSQIISPFPCLSYSHSPR